MNYRYLTILLATAATPAFAQDNPSQGEDDIVVTASRVPLTAREVGSSVSIVTAADIAREQIIFAKDVLQDLPGIQISSDRPGDAASVSIRGSDNDQVLYLIDGIELGDPSNISTQFQTDHLTTRDVARIEVLRGNQSSLYGSDAIGGVVNIITQRADADGITVNAEGEAGSHDTLNGGASLLGRTGALDFRLTASGYRHKGPSLADGVEDDEYWRYGFSGRVGLAASANVDLQLIGFWQDSHSDLDDTTADSLDTARVEEWALAGQGSYRSDDGAFRATATASRYKAQRRYFGTFYLPEGDLFEGTKDSLSLNASYDKGGVAGVAAGANYEEEYTDQVTSFSGMFDARIKTKSAYAEVALRPVTGLTITGAARIDDNSRFGSFGTYRVTGAYVVQDAVGGGDVKLRASYGSGAKAPGLYQLFDPSFGNPGLKVETSEGGDVGIDLGFGERFTAQFSYFFTRTRNEIGFDCDGAPDGCYLNFAKTRKSGIEIAFDIRPIEWLSIRQSYTYLEAEAPGANGAWLDLGRPKHSGSTSVTVTPVERLSLTARARYRDRNAASFGGVTEGYEVVDLLGSYDITGNIEVYGRVVNLFDKEYQMSFGKNALGQSFYGGVRLSF
ncbi:TonB-dependent receptor [Sphingomonas sp.]|uniref:TonB-dependent receptor plug domain-containing protein n=1 Tax=Sphingomonas sp. TaxID=28214 RepID=UPI0031E01AFB